MGGRPRDRRNWSARALLLKYIVASLFRVTWGFLLAVLVGVPFGLFLGWFRPAYQAFNPLIQVLRPISPIAWIPLAILWFGVSDAAPVFLIFLASVFPITVSATAAVQRPSAGLPPGGPQLRPRAGCSCFEG